MENELISTEIDIEHLTLELNNDNSTRSQSCTPNSMSTDSTITNAKMTENDHTNVIIIDWDDTLMCTSYLLSNIDYEINEHTKRLKCFNISGRSTQQQANEFVTNMEKAGNAAFELLTNVIARFDIQNIKIVTNGVKGWLPESLFVARSFCPNSIYEKIDALLSKHRIEIIYARNESVEATQWKTKKFDEILWQYFADEPNKDVNVITIGDQWTDHNSIEQSLTYSVHEKRISHHQIKLFAAPDCRYLCVVLQYISNLLVNEDVLFGKCDNDKTDEEQMQGILLEFEGYCDEKWKEKENGMISI